MSVSCDVPQLGGFDSGNLTLGCTAGGGRLRKDAKKGKPGKAELLDAAKQRQERLKALEGTREGRVRFLLPECPPRPWCTD